MSAMTPVEYNRRALERGELTDEQLVQLVRCFQEDRGLLPDGKAGPITRRVLEGLVADPGGLRVVDGWLKGPGVETIAAHPSWFNGPMARGPLAIVAHYTATDPGTARSLHERRMGRRPLLARNTSWHVTIAADGAIYQMVPLTHRARHCGRGEIGGRAPNEVSLGIELEGHGREFPERQVAVACRVWRAIVRAYAIPVERAMLAHSALDPKNRNDPGPVWMNKHAHRVLDSLK